MNLLRQGADTVFSHQELGALANSSDPSVLQGVDAAVAAAIRAGNFSPEAIQIMDGFRDAANQSLTDVIQSGNTASVDRFMNDLYQRVLNPPAGTAPLPQTDIDFLTHNSFRHFAMQAAAGRKFVRDFEAALRDEADVDVTGLIQSSGLSQNVYDGVMKSDADSLIQWRGREIDRLKQDYLTQNPNAQPADVERAAKAEFKRVYSDTQEQQNALGRPPSTQTQPNAQQPPQPNGGGAGNGNNNQQQNNAGNGNGDGGAGGGNDGNNPPPPPNNGRSGWDKAKSVAKWTTLGGLVVPSATWLASLGVGEYEEHQNYNTVDNGLNFKDIDDIESIQDAKDESLNNVEKRKNLETAFAASMSTLNNRMTGINNDLAPLEEKVSRSIALTAPEKSEMEALTALKTQTTNIQDHYTNVIKPAFEEGSLELEGYEQSLAELPASADLLLAKSYLNGQQSLLQDMNTLKTNLDTHNRKIENARLAAIGSLHQVPQGLDAVALKAKKDAEDAQKAAQNTLLSSAATAGSPAPDLDKAKEAAKKNIEAAALLNERMAETAEKYGTITTHASGSKSYTGLHERINNAIDSYTNAGKTDDADRMRELQKELATFTASLRTDYISKGAGLATAISTRGGQVESATEKSVANTFLADQGALVKELSGLNTALNSKYAQFETDLVTTPKPAANKASAGAGGSGDTDEESEQKTETALQKQAEEDAKKTPEERLKLYQGRIAAAEKQSTDYVKQAELYANNLNNMIEEVQGFKDRTDARGESNPDADEFLVALEAYKEKLTEQQNNITAQHDKIVEAGKSVAKSTVDTVDEAQILSEDSARDIRSAYRSGQKIVAIVGEAEEDLHEIARRNPGMGNMVTDYQRKAFVGPNTLGGGTGLTTRMFAPGPGGGSSILGGVFNTGLNSARAVHHTFAYDLKRDVAGDTTAENWYMAGEVGMWTFGAFAAIALINNVVPGVTIDGGMKWLMVGAAVIYALHATGETGKDFEQLASYKKYKEHNWADNKAQGSGQNLISGIKNNGDNVSMNIHSQKTGEISGTVNLYESGKYVAQSQDGKTITGIITDEAMKTQISAVSSGNGANLPPEIKQFFSALDNVSHGSNGVEERRDLTFQPAANNDTYNVRAGNTG